MSIRTRHDEFPLSMPDPAARIPKRRPEHQAAGEDAILRRIRSEIARRITAHQNGKAIAEKSWEYRRLRAKAYRELWALMGTKTFSSMARTGGVPRQTLSEALRGVWHPDRIRLGTFRAMVRLLGVPAPQLYAYLLEQHRDPIQGIPGTWRPGTRPRDLRLAKIPETPEALAQ